MTQHITARFDTLHQAESAATKLKAIRAQEVEISPWNGGDSEDSALALGGAGFAATGFASGAGTTFPASGSGISAGGFAVFPFMADDFVPGGEAQQGFLLQAVIANNEQEKAIKIVRDAGGDEL
jgi:hypothetical protein